VALGDLPAGAAPAIAEAMLKNLPTEYQLKQKGERFDLSNPLHEMEVVFTPDGPQINSGGNIWGMSLSGIGYQDFVKPVSEAKLSNRNGRMVYQRGNVSEWYINSRWGIEQGFTLQKSPEGKKDGVLLVVELSLSGDLLPTLDSNTLLLADAQGNSIVRYSGLQVFDSKEQNLPARFALTDTTLRIMVDDRDAEYPIIIDPWIQLATLTPSFGYGFGNSIAISGDTVVVGAPGYTTRTYIGFPVYDYVTYVSRGAAYVYEKPIGGWADMTEVARLTASDFAAGDSLGNSVSISGDTILVGAYGDENFRGSAYIFKKPDTGWEDSVETAKLTASSSDAYDYFGYSVALSDNTAVAGAYYGNRDPDDSEGLVYVFVKSGSVWVNSTETAMLTTTDTTGIDDFGKSVSISGDTIVVGAERGDGAALVGGSAYVFIKPVSGWVSTTVHTAKLRPAWGAANDRFGHSTAISDDAGTIVIGAPSAQSDFGMVYIFNKPTGGWTGLLPHNVELTANDAVTYTYFGNSVAINGGTVAVMGQSKPIYVFNQPAGGWVNMTEPPSVGFSGFSGVAVGSSVITALYGSGDYAVVYAQTTPKVVNIDSVEDTGDGSISEAETIRVAVTQLLVTFNTELADPAGNTNANDVTNPANYLLFDDGDNDTFNTVDCASGLAADDVQIPVDGVIYDNNSLTATLIMNAGLALPVGTFRLHVCGTTSIEDVAGQKLDGNGDGTTGDDFIINFSVPDTNGDGEPDYADPDDDGDGMSDVYELAHPVLDPLDPNDANDDPDNDGLTSLEEFNINPLMNPDSPDTDDDGIQDNIDDNPTVASNICSGGVAVLENLTITDRRQCAAPVSVTIEGTVKVEMLGYLEVISIEVTLNPGFVVDGEFLVISADPCPTCPSL